MEWIGIRKLLSEEDIRHLEKDLQIVLPEDYCKQILQINGGALRNAYWESPEHGHISYSRNVNLSREAKGNVYLLIDAINESERRYFPFGSVGNGDYFCFDLKTGKVVLYAHEQNTFYDICSSYTEFMNRLIVK